MIRAYYMFLRYKPTLHRYGHRVRVFLQQCFFQGFNFLRESCFYVIFKSYPSLLKSPEFLTLGVLKYAYNTTALKNPSPADSLATPFSPLLNFSALALHCSYLKSNIYTWSRFFHIYQNYDKRVISVFCSNYHIILSC